MTDPVPEPVDRFMAEHFALNSISAARQGQVATAYLRLAVALKDKPIEQATDADLRAWLVSMLDKGYKPSTVGWYLKMVKPFFRWAWRERLIDADTWMRIKEVNPPRGSRNGVPRPYSHKELMQLWDDLDRRFPYTTDLKIRRFRKGTSPFRSVRRHAMRLQLDAMIELALVCGLRRTEIYHLSIDDVHFDNKYIVVHGKRVDQNDRVREVPYPDSTREAIRAWFRMRGFLGPEPGIGLWLSITGPEPLVPMSWHRMRCVLKPLGPWQFHRLRHTCATERLRAGMDLEKLQRFLGHARIEQTLQYAQLVRSDIHKASEKIDGDFQRAIRRRAA